MRFQNWLLDEQLIIEAVELCVIIEALDNEKEIEAAADRARTDPSAIGDLLAIIRPVVEMMLARKIRGGKNHPFFEDIIQDVLMVVWRNLRGELGEPVRGPLIPWLGSVVHRTMLNAVDKKRRKRPGSLEKIMKEPENRLSIDMDVEGEVDRDDAMSKAIDSLSQMDREILKLYYFEDMTHEQIGQKLGIPIGTSKRRLSDAKQRLKVALEKFGIDSE